MKKQNSYIFLLPFIYFCMLALAVSGLTFFVWNTSHPAIFEREVSDKPGPDRLFIPMKIEVAKELFAHPKILKVEFTIKVNDDKFTIEGNDIQEMLDIVDMRPSSLWKELNEYDSALQVAEDFGSLTLSIQIDKISGERYVNVPAGLLRAYI